MGRVRAGARLRVDRHGATAGRGDAGAAAPRVPGAAARRVPLHAVLRDLPAVAGTAAAVDAAGVPGRREGVRRLLGEEAVHLGREDRRTDPRRALRGGAGRVEFHLRRGDEDAAVGRLDREPRAGAGVPRRLAVAVRARPAAQRGDRPRAGTSPAFSGRTTRWRSTTARRCCRRDRGTRGTRPRSRSVCRSRSGGSWRGCGTRPTSRWPRSTSASPSCSRS